MGGGGVVRAAAKVGIGSGLGIVTNRFHRGAGGSPNFNPAGASRPVSTVINSSDSQETEEVSVGGGGAQKPLLWELEDWEFAGGEEEEVVLNSGKALPRMVFGPTATMEEAKEATAELKDALDRVYLSSSNSTGWIPSIVGRVPGLSVLTSIDNSETGITASAPDNALQAFKLLSESTAAQSVVASIACDQNVWNAVLGNPALLDFLESQKSSARIKEVDSDSIADSDSEYRDSPLRFEFIPDFSIAGRTGTGFAITVQSVRLKVLQMISSVSEMLQNIFGPSMSDRKDDDGNPKFMSMEKTVGASLMGLAVMAIMVVLLKRS